MYLRGCNGGVVVCAWLSVCVCACVGASTISPPRTRFNETYVVFNYDNISGTRLRRNGQHKVTTRE